VRGATVEAAVVATLTVTFVGLLGFNVTVPGVGAQEESSGAPVHVRVTVWLNPPPGESSKGKVATWPAATLAEVLEPDAGVKLKSWPVPESATACGLPGALSVIVSVPVMLPLAVGSKNTPIVQLTLTGRLLVQPLVSPKLLDAWTFEIVSGAVPELVTVTLIGRPLVPTY
jgi:hypothetical protein